VEPLAEKGYFSELELDLTVSEGREDLV